MKTILIAGIIIECIVLVLLTVFKKWTKAAFIAVAAVTAAGCLAAGFMLRQTQQARTEIDQRGSLYIAARLVQEDRSILALEAVAQVDDEETEAYNSRAVRGLIYNRSEAYNTAQDYLQDSQNTEGGADAAAKDAEGGADAAAKDAEGSADAAANDAEGSADAAAKDAEGVADAAGKEPVQAILEASAQGKRVDDDTMRAVTEEAISLIGASAEEAAQWETQMKVRYLGMALTEDEKPTVNSRITLVQNAIKENRHEEAYNLMMENPSGDPDAIIISQMYLLGYNNRIMSNTDDEYAYLWNQAAQLQAELNLASLNQGDQDEEGEDAAGGSGGSGTAGGSGGSGTAGASDEEDTGVSEEEDEYLKLQARYQLAQEELRQEAVKRSFNYLSASPDTNETTAAGRNLQLARLMFTQREHDKAKEYLDEVFVNNDFKDDVWLGREIAAFKKALILSISDANENEYNVLFDSLMNALYQGVFRDYSDSGFKDFVISYLRERFGSLVIRRVTADAFPQVTAEVSVTDPDLALTADNLVMADTGQEVSSFDIVQTDTSALSIAFVLDRSGSMQGSNLADSKDAIRSCIAQLSDETMISFVVFDNESEIIHMPTDNKYAVMSSVMGIEAQGGTNIASGLSSAIETVSAMPGARVIILLTDGFDGGDSQSLMNDAIARAAGAGINVYTIGLEGCNESYLQNISTQTGGQFIMVENTARLNAVYASIQNAMTHSYAITYSVPEGNESEYRDVTVRHKDAIGEARRKYSTRKEEPSQEEEASGEAAEVTEDTQKSDFYRQIGGTGERR